MTLINLGMGIVYIDIQGEYGSNYSRYRYRYSIYKYTRKNTALITLGIGIVYIYIAI